MINKNKIVFCTKTYYTPTYGSPAGIKILRLLANDLLLVQAGIKNKPFVRHIKHVYNTSKAAVQGGRDWEHGERMHRRKKKERKNNVEVEEPIILCHPGELIS